MCQLTGTFISIFDGDMVMGCFGAIFCGAEPLVGVRSECIGTPPILLIPLVLGEVIMPSNFPSLVGVIGSC